MSHLQTTLYRRVLQSIALEWYILLLCIKYKAGGISKTQTPEKESGYILLIAVILGVVLNKW